MSVTDYNIASLSLETSLCKGCYFTERYVTPFSTLLRAARVPVQNDVAVQRNCGTFRGGIHCHERVGVLGALRPLFAPCNVTRTTRLLNILYGLLPLILHAPLVC